MHDAAEGQRILVSIDDTDNLYSRGTGFRARQLGLSLAEANLAIVRGISRHQLFVHEDIPYTSHNSALCLDLIWLGKDIRLLKSHVREFLAVESAPGSDAAFCIASFSKVPPDVVAFGIRAKSTVLTRADAMQLSEKARLHLEGVTGDHGGVIGAIASVGLRKGGHDGRFVWVKGVRELSGAQTVGSLLADTGIDVIRPLEANVVQDDALVNVGSWPRPVLLDDQAVLLVEKSETTDDECNWKILPSEIIRQY